VGYALKAHETSVLFDAIIAVASSRSRCARRASLRRL
jgi:hypothetical protein